MLLRRHERVYRLLRALRTRWRCLRYGLRHVHWTAYVAKGSTLSRDLHLGPHAYVGPGAMLCPGVSIGAYSMLGPRVTIVGRDHLFDKPGTPTIFSGRPPQRPTVIEDDVWIAACATLIAGVRVGRGAIVAAGAVVATDVASFSVVAGVPARVLRKRFSDADETAHRRMLDGPLVNGPYCPPQAEGDSP
jgi:acetyltransferase-like isoleucine patch superfamily enzyme